MMVTVADGDGLLSGLFSENKVSSGEFYASLAEKVNDDDIVDQLCEEIALMSAEVTTHICEDLTNASTCMAALQGLGLCLHHANIVKSFKEADVIRLFDGICKTVNETADKNVCTRALWCLATQNVDAGILEQKVTDILDAIENALCEKNFKSMTVEHEGLNAYIKLLECVPGEMVKYPVKWAKLIYPLLLHGAVKVRERAEIAMELGMPAILEHQNEVAKLLVADLKNKDKSPSLLIEQINHFMVTKQEVFAMKVWECYVTILGSFLHHGQLINRLLPFVEMAFKNSSPVVKCAAYRAWQTLIKNFSLNPDIVSDGKRVKLIMQVFKLSNAKVESVAVAKVNVWWYFITALGPNATTYFETVVAPLLNYTIGGLAGKGNAGSRTPTSRLGMIASPATPNVPDSPMPQFRALHSFGAQVLGRLFGDPDPSLPKPKFKIDKPDHTILNGVPVFVKHSALLIRAVQECIGNLQEDLDEGLLFHIWYALVAHVKNVLAIGNKGDASEVLSAFLSSLQQLVNRQSLSPEKLLKLIQAVLALSPKALTSSSFAIGTSQTGMMQGTPVLFLIDLLFHHRLLETCATQERFFLLFEKLIACGLTNQSGALAFCKAVLQTLDQAASKVEQRETLWRMWSAVVNPLHNHISETNEVNAGDALEHDFTCLYAALLLPLAHLLGADLPTTTHRSMMKTWTELFTTFSRLAAMVANAEANICCEELCSRIVNMIDNNRDVLQNVRCLETLSHVLKTIILHTDFSGFTGNSLFNMNPTAILSPGKFMNKKKQRPLGNLHSFVSLLVLTSTSLHENGDNEDGLDSKKRGSVPGLQIAALGVIEVLVTLFTHLPSSAIITVATEKLAPLLAQFLEGSAKKPMRRIFSTQVLDKIEKMFLDFTTCITGRCKGPFDSEFLKRMGPVLKVAFLHPRRPVKNQCMVLWNATFANSPPLEYPEDLKPILGKVREKSPIVLPGWIGSHDLMSEDTPISQMSQGGDGDVSLPNIVGLPSPHKKLGSFIDKVASPEIKKSPLKRAKSPVISGAKKKLGLDDLRDSDFVVIAPSSGPKRRVLTDHQREVLSEKKVLPAMYSALDVSQDRSLMSQSSNTNDTPSVEASQDAFSFAVPLKKAQPAVRLVSKSDDSSSEGEGRSTRSSSSKRKSVTFSLGDKESPKDESVQENIAQSDSLANHALDSSPKKEPTSLLGQSLSGNTNSPKAPPPEIDLSDVKVKTETNSEATGDNESQASEQILKQKPRASRSTTTNAASKQLRSPEKRSRTLSAEKSPKKPSAVGMKKLENWFTLSPKPVVSTSPVTLVEDTQQYIAPESGESPNGPLSSPLVGETPEKMDIEDPLEPENTECTKRLFAESQSPFVPDTEMDEDPTPALNADVIPDSIDFNPVVQLARLPQDILIKNMSPKESHLIVRSPPAKESLSDDTVTKVTTPSGTSIKKLTRRRSVKLSKASQETPTLVSPIDMDDIIPSSQDSFGFVKVTREVTKTDTETVQTEQKSKSEISEEEKGTSTLESKVNDKADEPVNSESIRPLEESNAENPDISPVDISDVPSSQDSDATIVSKPKRGRKRKSLNKKDNNDSLSESPLIQDSLTPESPHRGKRPSRSRSTPKKFEDTDNSTASSTPEKIGKKNKGTRNSDAEVKLRPNETLVSRAYDSSQDTQEQPPLRGRGRRKSIGKEPKPSTEESSTEQKGETNQSDEKGKKDTESDSEDNIPITQLLAKRDQGNKAVSDDDDVPLNQLLSQEDSNVKSKDDAQEQQVPLLFDEDCNFMSPTSLSAGSEITSTPKTNSEEKKCQQKRNMLSKLSIDMKTSPVNKRLRSKVSLKLNRSLNSIQRHRRSPGSPGRQGHKRMRSKSVSPLKRKLKVKHSSPSPQTVTTPCIVRESAEPVPKTTDPVPKVTEPTDPVPKVTVTVEVVKETKATTSPIKPERQSPRKSPKKASPLKSEPPTEMPSPRRSPRKLNLAEESPQKKSLSPTRQSISMDTPETPTSGTKPQSRARLILERSRLFASRSSNSSGSLNVKKKFTTLKPTGQSSESPTKSILKATAVENEEATSETVPGGSGSPPPSKSSVTANSPSFRPIQLPRMYSPSASPSAGILKKRKLSGEVPMDSPSPPNKQRRVSFNEAVDVCTLNAKESPRPVNRCLDMPAKTGRLTSPLVTTSKVTTNQSKFLTSKSDSFEGEKDDAGFTIPQPFNKRKEENSQNSNSIKSTQDTQLNCEDPLYPEMVDCPDSIDQLLPQLTSSTWIRGLGQLVRSKNIRTVGDLCRLTEYDINQLPIRTPKVATVRQVLQNHESQWNLRKQKSPSTSQASLPDSVEIMEEGSGDDLGTKEALDSPLSPKKPLPSVEDALAISPIKEADTSLESMTTEDVQLTLKDEPSPVKSFNIAAGQIIGKLGDSEDTQESDAQDFEFRDPFGSATVTDNISAAARKLEHFSSKDTSEATCSSSDDKTEKSTSRKLLKDIETMAKGLTPEVLDEMPSSYLVAMHMHLNNMMTNVIVAQSNKCPLSPTSSQSSQSQSQ